MEDTSQSRILEPIDSNSLSLISSSSASNIHGNTSGNIIKLSTIRPVSPPIIDFGESSQNKWQFDRKEFAFESNSTPSKNNDNKLQPRIHSRKRRSQLMGAKPRVPSKLHHTTSKLDLLDEDRLTTLPICPPKGLPSNLLNVKRLKLNPVNEIRIHNNKASRRISYGIPLISADNQENNDGEVDENEHPIVLIEDYIKYPNDSHEIGAKKKVSIADLKSKMSRRNDMHIPIKLKTTKATLATTPTSSITLIPHISEEEQSPTGPVVDEGHVIEAFQGIENDCDNDVIIENDDHTENQISNNNESNISDSVRNILDVIMRPKTLENDKYLSDLRIQSQLKTCVVCDCPLYEISSIIADTDDYKEIVCGKCTEKYEEAAKIFENYEFETSEEISIDSSRSSFNSISEMSHSDMAAVEESIGLFAPTTSSQRKERFSQELITRLKVQSQQYTNSERCSPDPIDCPTMAWFLEAKKKIRWRWRASGLFPRFISKHYDSKSINLN